MRPTRKLQNFLVCLIVSSGAASAYSATITVAPGEVVEAAGNGKCSLKEAIRNAESNSDTSGGDCAAGSGSDVIELAAGSTYTLSSAMADVAGTVNVGLPEIRSNITINGNGAIIQRDPALFNTTPCSGSGAKFRILKVGNDGNLTIRGTTLQNGCLTSEAGGAIHNHGVLVLDGVKVLNNTAPTAGGIKNDGTLTMSRSTLANNVATSGAAGGFINSRTMTVVESTINNNTTPGTGGGGLITGGPMTFTNSTVSGNAASGLGGGLMASVASMIHSTIANNRGAQDAAAPTPGSGLFGTFTLNGSLLAGQVNGSNCRGSITATNSAADDASCSSATVVAAPMLGALADNGGPTQTHMPQLGSPLIDAGNNTSASGLTVDQRGATRIANGTVDFGAVEYAGNTDVDGVSDTTENGVPSATGGGTGDGNGDGITDYLQNYVTSIPAFGSSSNYGTIVSLGNRSLTAISTSARPGTVPSSMSAPYGAFAFTATGVPIGGTEAFELYVPYNAAIVGALKQNRTTGIWENVATSVTHIGTVKTKITFSLTDGGAYDADGLANGQIQDPIVPFIMATSVPTLSEWGMLLLSGLLLATGLTLAGRRRGGSYRS